MEVYLNRIDGIDDSYHFYVLIQATLTRELEMDVRNETLAHTNTSYNGLLSCALMVCQKS